MTRKQVAVIGGGIAGISAALELCKHDLDIHLIEKSHFLGGKAINYNCKAVNGRCRQCGACLVEQKLNQLNKADNVHYHLASRVLEFEDKQDFRLQLLKEPVYRTEKEQKILEWLYKTNNRENLVLKGISKNNQPLYALDLSRFEELEKKSSSLALTEIGKQLGIKSRRKESIQVDALIAATGFRAFNPGKIGTYHYQNLDNVISALDMEKIRKSRGEYLRPSDDRPPGKISFIQCVGSRSESKGNPWCSRVCCSYALKMAEAISAENPDIDITFFYMDMQNMGVNSTISPLNTDFGFRFIRMMPVDILPGTDSGVLIRYMSPQTERMESEEFDLSILSVGTEPNPENTYMAKLMDKPLDRHGFFRESSRFDPGFAKDKGVFAAGTATGPKSIAESAEHATEAVNKVVNYLSKQEKKDYGYEDRFILDKSSGYRERMDRHFHGK